MHILLRTARKEFGSFFSSPMAFIFLGAFLAITLFAFFWIETFFARNIAELRPLFEWMPILLIFLAAAITMRMWAEEHRAGTLEFLLTSPVQPLVLVAGKFLACLGLIAVALALTFPLAVSVSFLGQLDWGPVFGGYLATLFLAAAYIAIGLYVSVNSENQIISLITTVVLCGLFYLIGSDTLAAFFGNKGAELMKLFGSGSRFDSITRGVIDVRDIYYYLSIMAAFLCLNIYGLEKIRWAGNPANALHRRWRLLSGVVIANIVVANFWLAPINSLRVDLTQQNIYSISAGTRSYLSQIKEPLLIRGYFSPQTHPLLAPLVPRLRDLLKEYGIAGGDRVYVEFIDPLENPELEQEAGQKYGIRPIPFQTTSKYQASVTNSYFDILIKYGDQFETLGFRDLIEVKAGRGQDVEVELRNPEYDITKAIKKVLYSYQGGGDIFATIDQPVQLTGYFSPDHQLPAELVSLKNDLQELVEPLAAESGKKFSFTSVDPEANGGVVAKQLSAEYGLQPMRASLFDRGTFWFYMILASGGQLVEVPLPESLAKDELERSLMAALKRFDNSFTKNIALHAPEPTPPMPQLGMADRGPQFNALQEVLTQEHAITETDLENGRVPAEADLLLVVAPENLDERQLFGIDQFLMQGGTVVLATSPFSADLSQRLLVAEHESGLADWLSHHGIKLGESMVMDSRNSPFPVPVERDVGGFIIRETRMVDYPYFVDIRTDGMNKDNAALTGLNQIIMNWASPLEIDAEKNSARVVTPLLESSSQSWLSDSTDVQPDFQRYGNLGFPAGEEQQKYLLGVAIEGSFSSYFAGKPSPLAGQENEADDETSGGEEGSDSAPQQVILRQLDKSPDSARIVVFSSNNFLTDIAVSIGTSVNQTEYLEPLQLVANTVDWALEDQGLLDIRGRSHFSRPLVPLSKDMQLFWEYFNYVLAIIGLVVVWIVNRIWRTRTTRKRLELLQHAEGRIG